MHVQPCLFVFTLLASNIVKLYSPGDVILIYVMQIYVIDLSYETSIGGQFWSVIFRHDHTKLTCQVKR